MGLNSDIREIAIDVARQVVKEELKQLELALRPVAPPAPEPMLTVDDVARLCRVSSKTVVRWISKGLLRSTKKPGMREYRIALRDYEEFARASPPGLQGAGEDLDAQAATAVARLALKKAGGRP